MHSEKVVRRVFTISEEPRERLYECIIELAAGQAATAYLIVRSTIQLTEQARSVLLKLRAFEIAVKTVSQWPGTALSGGATAEMHQYRVDRELVQVLRTAAEGLYEWQQPELPEDLGFVRHDGSVSLASIAHEQDSYCELSQTEKEALLKRCPDLALVDTTP